MRNILATVVVKELLNTNVREWIIKGRLNCLLFVLWCFGASNDKKKHIKFDLLQKKLSNILTFAIFKVLLNYCVG
jgi:hypothetical protein